MDYDGDDLAEAWYKYRLFFCLLLWKGAVLKLVRPASSGSG